MKAVKDPLTMRRPRADEAAVVAALMVESSAALHDFCFTVGGVQAASFLTFAAAQADGIFGSGQQVVAVSTAGRVVATMTLYAGRDFRRLTWQTTRQIASFYGPWRALRVACRSLATLPLFTTPRRDGMFLANICVDRSVRGTGVFSLLLQEAVAEARRRGCRVLELDVSYGNDAARAAYEHLGFRVQGTRAYWSWLQTQRWLRLEGFARMELVVPAG